MLGIYLHIPYCRTLCPYCDFVKARSRDGVPQAFVDALCREIAAIEGPRDAASIFFGGGTPSMASAEQLEQILRALAAKFSLHDPEITIEANPDDLSPELVRAWRAAGINRVSLGVQSFDDQCLRKLGRRHDAAKARTACEIIAAEFDNWNLDLIFGAPPIETWSETLATAIALNPPHIATYGLTYEPGTPFEKRAAEGVDDETSLRLYQEAEAALAAYDHYEVSNFAKPGRQSTHNLVYWHNRDYAGFGTGAYAYINGVRARNHAGLDDYLRAPGAKEESLTLSQHEIKLETLIQHFRLREGLPRARYTARFGVAPEADFATPLADLKARGLLEDYADFLRPTAQGYYLNNEIGLALVG